MSIEQIKHKFSYNITGLDQGGNSYNISLFDTIFFFCNKDAHYKF